LAPMSREFALRLLLAVDSGINYIIHATTQ
jgi:hypothetical protein